MVYNSLGEYERIIRKQFLDSQGRSIESNPIAFLALANSIAALDEGLREAKKLGKPQVWKNEASGEACVVCYPTGEIEFLEDGDKEGFLKVKRAQRDAKDAAWKPKYTDMTWEERVRFRKLEPLGMDDVLDIHRALRDYDGDLAEISPPEGPLVEKEEE